MTDDEPVRVLAGFDGSPAAGAAIDAAARLFPRARAWILHLWTAPFASAGLRQRLWTASGDVKDFMAAVEREGAREAERTAATGVTLAQAAGWRAEPVVARSYGGDGLRVSELAEELDADVVLLGSRGLGGTKAVLGSVSDMVVHYTPRPALVVPHPLLSAEEDALDAGPVVVGWDGSDGARGAMAAAARLFPGRRLLAAGVGDQETTADVTVTHLLAGRRLGAPGRSVADALATYARQEAAAVIVVGSRGRSAMREILLGSTAMAVLHHAHRPVLVVPTPR
ncbi:universal stress protein [Asanoa sp. WMMD1127]|uniref:universal stress protein n=1 Tax=Asanoa sp. WMMD1127 TaxID=3016107 RepID=UPI002415E75F|nr:universal stress protein [Asanoa sp. WMMD1127]MDG4825344.1 universal stress protein [Asanoa sp. WMMD1127]